MYKIYTTDGIILKHTNFSEANLSVRVLTRDFGLIMTTVQAGRMQKSKLRSAVVDFSLVNISIIKSKNGWKMTGAKVVKNYFFGSPKKNWRTLTQLCAVLLRLIPGEAPHPEIFDLVKSGFENLATVPEYDLPLFEALFMLRLLRELGYVADDTRTDVFLSRPTEWDHSILKKIVADKKEIIAIINQGLEASQLIVKK